MADKISISEIKGKLEDIFEDASEYGFSFVDFLLGDYDEEVAEKANLKWIEQDGGHEGGAESCHTIFSIGDITYKVTYSYYSHHGFDTDYAEAYVVTPAERLVTFYV